MRDLTESEEAVLNTLAGAVSIFAALPQVHPADMEEFVAGTHVLQNIVLARPATESRRPDNDPDPGAPDA